MKLNKKDENFNCFPRAFYVKITNESKTETSTAFKLATNQHTTREVSTFAIQSYKT